MNNLVLLVLAGLVASANGACTECGAVTDAAYGAVYSCTAAAGSTLTGGTGTCDDYKAAAAGAAAADLDDVTCDASEALDYGRKCAAGKFYTATTDTAVSTCGACTGAGVLTCTDATTHTHCLDEFYLATDTCTACTANTKTCDATASLTCMPGYYLDENADPDACAQLTAISNSAFGAVVVGNALGHLRLTAATGTGQADCDTFERAANGCTDNLACTGGLCKSDGSACTSAEVTCDAAQLADFGRQCEVGYFYTEGSAQTDATCTQCTTGALSITCTTADADTECAVGAFDNSGVCTTCDGALAATCSAAGATDHLTCLPGNYLATAGTCTTCGVGNIAECNDGDGATVTECAAGFYVNAAADGCTADASITNTAYGSVMACDATDGCEVTAGTGTCDAYKAAAAACTTAPETACSDADVTCDAAEAAAFGRVCAVGYFYEAGATTQSGACTQCNTGALAITCTAADADTVCAVGAFLDTATCTTCGTGALTCTSATAHDTCAPGYFLDTTCTPCESTTDVLECTSNTVATTCAAGFFLETTGDAVACTACAAPACAHGNGLAAKVATDVAVPVLEELCAGTGTAQLTTVSITAAGDAAEPGTGCDQCAAGALTCDADDDALTCQDTHVAVDLECSATVVTRAWTDAATAKHATKKVCKLLCAGGGAAATAACHCGGCTAADVTAGTCDETGAYDECAVADTCAIDATTGAGTCTTPVTPEEGQESSAGTISLSAAVGFLALTGLQL